MYEMLTALVEDASDFELAGRAETAKEALAGLSEAKADLVVIDVSLPEMSGIELAGEIKTRWPELLCLMLSGHQEVTYAERALAAGAHGYVVKGDPYEIPEAMRHVLGGEKYLSKSLRSKLQGEWESE